jgi:hypothetical protein
MKRLVAVMLAVTVQAFGRNNLPGFLPAPDTRRISFNEFVFHDVWIGWPTRGFGDDEPSYFLPGCQLIFPVTPPPLAEVSAE